MHSMVLPLVSLPLGKQKICYSVGSTEKLDPKYFKAFEVLCFHIFGAFLFPRVYYSLN